MTFPWLVVAVLGVAAATTLTARFTRQYFPAAMAGAAGMLLLHGYYYFDYTSDDAYISFRYARNLSDGLGVVWNPGEYVEGYSNFLWVGILAGLHKLGADIVLSARWLGFALAMVAAAGTWRLCHDLLEGVGGRIAGVVAVLLLGACGTFALWTFAGLESSLFAVLLIGAVLLHIRESDGLRPPVSGVLWGFAALTRPESPLLFAVSAAFKLFELPIRSRADGGHFSLKRLALATAWLIVWGAGFAAVFVPYFIWRYDTYDYLFPNTYYAKVGEGLDQYDRGVRYALGFAREYSAWLLLLVPFAMVYGSISRARSVYLLAIVLAYGAYVIYVGGDSLFRYRFFAPLMPLIYALITTSAASLFSALRLEREPPRYAREGVIAAAIAGLLVFTLQASTNSVDVIGASERKAVRDRVEIGRWLEANVAADTVIAVVPAGAIPYESRLETIDMLGINDEHIAHRNLDIGSFAAGHEKYDSEYVLNRQPDIIILFDSLLMAPAKQDDYSVLSFAIIPAVVDMVLTPRLWVEYEARAVELREGAWFNLLVRRDGANGVRALTRSP
jgi:hypothetical protein